MPYTGPDDPKLPANIQKLSTIKRRAFVGAFNSASADTRPGESAQARESRAFATANAAAARAGAKDDEELEGGEGEKHYGGDSPALVAYEAPAPFAGATSFDEIDDWQKSARLRGDIGLLQSNYQMLVENIWDGDGTLSEKARRIVEQATELERRIAMAGRGDGDEALGYSELMLDQKALEWPNAGPFAFARRNFLWVYDQKDTHGQPTAPFVASDFAVAPSGDPVSWRLPLVDASGTYSLARISDAIEQIKSLPLDTAPRAIARISAALELAAGEQPVKVGLRERLGDVKESELGGSFLAFKDAAGANRWLAVYTNSLRDREGERFDDSAHKAYEAWVDRTKSYPALRLWHLPADVGRADMVAYHDGFLVATGTFKDITDPETGAVRVSAPQIAAALKEAGDLGCSHGYYYDEDAFRNGVYYSYRSFEITALPRARAANEITGFHAGAEVPTMDQSKRAWLEQVGGPQLATAIEDNIGRLRKEATEKGISFKDFSAQLMGAVETIGAKDEAPAAAAEPAAATAAVDQTAQVAAAADAAAASAPAAAAATTPEASARLAAAPGTPDLVGLLGQAMEQALAPVKAQIGEITAAQATQAAEIKGLKETDDAKVAALASPRVNPTAAAASVDSANVLTGDAEKAMQGMKTEAEGPGSGGPTAPYMQQLAHIIGAAGAGAAARQN